jgi:membrane-bound serine protease (ClpP class)
LGVGGAIALAVGGLILFDDAAVRVAVPVVIACTAMTVAFLAVLAWLALRARKTARVNGPEGMVGRRASVLQGLSPRGLVRLDGETWNAEATGSIPVGAEVEVTGVEGLTLRVRPTQEA